VQPFGGLASTDKIAAMQIARHAEAKEKQGLPEWEPMPPKLARARAIVSVLAWLAHLATAAGNIRHAVSLMAGKRDRDIPGVTGDVAAFCKEKKGGMESELCGIVSEIFQEQSRLLKAVPGMGAKTASAMLACCRGMENFKTHRQLAAFAGVSPAVKESGTSARGSGRVAKAGNPRLHGMQGMRAVQRLVRKADGERKMILSLSIKFISFYLYSAKPAQGHGKSTYFFRPQGKIITEHIA
jgi:transposase